MGNHYDPRDEEDLQAKADAAHAEWVKENDALKERVMDKCDAHDFNVPQQKPREKEELRDRVHLMLRDRIVAARSWLADREPAVSGAGGTDHTFVTARILLSFDLDVGVVTALMSEWNQRNTPPWSEVELLEIVRNADKYGTPKRHTYSGLNDLAEKIDREAKFNNVENFQAVGMPVSKPDNMKPTNPKDAVGIRKPRFFSGMSAHVRRLVGIGMLEGAMKYGRHNYRPAAVRASVYYDATNEHLDSWWEGEDIDPDSKLNHVIKAICSLYVLADAIVTGNLVDDRPPKTRDITEFKKELQPLVDELFARYPNPKEAYTNLNSSVDSLVKPAQEK